MVVAIAFAAIRLTSQAEMSFPVSRLLRPCGSSIVSQVPQHDTLAANRPADLLVEM